jgi:hypothetical protein
MSKANIHRRDTLEQVYPPDDFASDAAQNGRASNALIRGVRILSAPDAAGEFDFERTTQQIGEPASAAFLAPYRREDRMADAGRDGPATIAAAPDPLEGYQAFLGDILVAAQRFGFRPEDTPGLDEPRLRGLRQ